MTNPKISDLLKYLQHGTVIKYSSGTGGDTYLIIGKVKEGKVIGQMASVIGVNGISLEELAKKEGLCIAEFTKLESQ